MTAKLTTQGLVYGTVFTFTRDLTFLGPRWTDRKVGVHFLVGELSESGYTFSAFNTATQRWDDMMAENWIFEETRIIGIIPTTINDESTVTCSRCQDLAA